jgi:hypothetical protein
MGLAALGSKAQNVENLFLSIGLKRIRDRRCEVCGGEGIVTSIHTGGEFEEDANAYRCAGHPPGRLPAPFFARPVAETATKNASSPAAV